MLTAGGTVIIGAGHAGFTTAGALRDAEVTGPVVLVDTQDGLPYQRPPLSKAYLLGKVEPHRVAFRPAAYYERRDITLLAGRSAEAVDRSTKTVRLSSGGQLRYDTLVLATGARARALPVPGADLPDVAVLRTMADADLLRERMARARRPVVVGGGFIGLEFAAVAVDRGTPVTVVEATARLLPRSVSAATAAHLTAAHRCWGNTIVTGAGVRRILGDSGGRTTAVELNDGRVVDADLVVVGVGAVPDTQLAQSMGLAVDDGVLTDRYLRTCDPVIFAVGDCARIADEDGHPSRRRESVQNATDQARAVARTISGDPTAYTATPWFWSDQRDLKLQIAGTVDGHDDTVVAGEPAAFSTYCFRHGQLVAVESVNRPTDHVAARKLLDQPDRQLDARSIRPDFALAEHLRSP